MILPHNSLLTKLLISQAHITTLHGGTQLTLNYLRKNYWILRAKNTIKHFIHKCTICFKYNIDTQNQLMGDLCVHTYHRKLRGNSNFHLLQQGIDFCTNSGTVSSQCQKEMNCISKISFLHDYIH